MLTPGVTITGCQRAVSGKGDRVAEIERSIEVSVPVRTAYDQWTQFEEFPRFMEGVEEVRQLDDSTLHWKVAIAGVTREWQATIVEQVPDRRVAWTSVEGTHNAGQVSFEPVGPGGTRVTLRLDFEPEGLLENGGRQARDRRPPGGERSRAVPRLHRATRSRDRCVARRGAHRHRSAAERGATTTETWE